MQVIQLKHPHTMNQDDLPAIVMALGYFDGVHLGHKKVITTAKQLADQYGYKSAVMTFYPHPSIVLQKGTKRTTCITSLQDKEEEIRKLGIDYLFIVEFTPAFADLLPQQFVDEYIINLHVKHVVAGFDYSYGRLGKGTMETLPFHSRGAFTQTVVEKVVEKNKKISSTFIRQLIQTGKMEDLPAFLGRYYKTRGTVVHGEKRGRDMGFPTANIKHTADYILPDTGVYAACVKIWGNWYDSLLNIGFKPTFHAPSNTQPTIEVHILNFSEMIYGEKIEIVWLKKIRPEKKFESVDQLISQIQRDQQEVLRYFKNMHREKLAFCLKQ